MTREDRQMLEDLAKKVAQTPPPPRDAEAEEFIRKNIGNRPDALYLMTQTVLIQNLAMEHAQQEIEQLKQRAAQQPGPEPQGQGSFLGRGPSGWQQAGYAPPPPQQASYAPPQQASYAPPPAAGPAGGGMSSFLRSAGTTAAGVAAGALAFEGIRSMFGGVEHMFGGHQQQMGGSGFFGGGDREGETIVNNYYDRPEGDSSLAEGLAPDDAVQYDDTDVPADDDYSGDDSFDDSSSDDDQV